MKSPDLLPPTCESHLRALEHFYARPSRPGFLTRFYAKLLAHRYNQVINSSQSVLEIGCGEGQLLALLNGARKLGIDLAECRLQVARKRHPNLEFRCGEGESLENDLDEAFDVIVLSDVLNQSADVEVLLRNLHRFSHRNTRLIINIHNTLWRPFIRLGRHLRLAQKQPPSNWLSKTDVCNLCVLADWEVFKSFGHILLPVPIPLVASLVNRWLAPLAGWACLTTFLVARRLPTARHDTPIVSVVVPARNEAGSIPALLERVPRLGSKTQLIIIEGNSTDNTWDVIEGLPSTFAGGDILKLRQTGKGKGNAVREAFAHATGDIVTILDADLTMPPEDLPKYIASLVSGKADFANGVRLVYPMDDKAMQFANLCANKAFSLIFSWLLGQPVKDTLCGTKAMWREDYIRLDANRSFFGDFDPFGDFDLIFGADKLNLKIVDIPIRYKERTYGETNIQRWRHGMILAWMVIFCARKLKFV